MKKILKYCITAITAALLIMTSGKCVEAQSSSDAYRVEAFETSISPSVTISTSGGFIQVLGSDIDEVMIEMFVKQGSRYLDPSDTDLSDYDITINKTGDAIIAKSVSTSNRSWFFNNSRNYSISFRVTVPIEATVAGETSGGSVKAQNLINGIELETSGGSVTAKDIEGGISLRTSGGSITLENLIGTINARTSGGSISAKNIQGEANVRTSGGSIRLDDISAKISARTSGGSINGSFLSINDDINLRTSGGSIRLEIPDVTDFRVDLKGGRVDAPLRNFTGEVEKNHVKGKIGNGGPQMYAKTSAGTVRLSYN